MQDEIVISVRNLKKKFKVYNDKGSSLKEKLLFFRRNRYEERWVLNGISFDLRRGEAIGLIGKNGCGKSTTLKLLTRIMYPTSGQVKIKGRVSSLIELGAGFHPDMSGRENIYTNASIFGLTKEQIDERLEDIIAFSELEEFIDNPVRTYSSGMYMRLAFSVAINVEADILLIDEILAVGDVSFQKKCFEKLKQIKRAGTTIVIVSHSLGQIEEICDRSIWIEDGQIKMQDKPETVHKAYLKQMENERLARIGVEYAHVDVNKKYQFDEVEPYFDGRKVYRIGERKIYFTEVVLTDAEHNRKAVFRNGDDMYVILRYKNRSKKYQALFSIKIFNENNVLCFMTNTDTEFKKKVTIKEEGTISIVFHELPLLQGKYILDVDVYDDSEQIQDMIHEASGFYVEADDGYMGITMLNTIWKVE